MAEQPPRKSPRVAIAVGAAVAMAVIAFVIWRNKPTSLIDRAARLQVGQDISDVEEIMGATGYVAFSAPHREIRCFGPVQTTWVQSSETIESATGRSLPVIPAIDDWPVVIHFTPKTGKVFRIKRGDEIIGTKRSPSVASGKFRPPSVGQ